MKKQYELVKVELLYIKPNDCIVTSTPFAGSAFDSEEQSLSGKEQKGKFLIQK